MKINSMRIEVRLCALRSWFSCAILVRACNPRENQKNLLIDGWA